MHITRQKDSRAVLICSTCQIRRYINQADLNWLEQLKQLKERSVQVEILPHHCGAMMEMLIFPPDMPDPITPTDLDLVYIRVQDETGHWVSIHAGEATDQQFSEWAKTCIEIQGEDAPWGPVERADFCDRLYQAGELHILKRRLDEE
jgi:hypothetical protein